MGWMTGSWNEEKTYQPNLECEGVYFLHMLVIPGKGRFQKYCNWIRALYWWSNYFMFTYIVIMLVLYCTGGGGI